MNGADGVYGLYIYKGKVSDTEITGNAGRGWRNAGNLGSQSAFAKARFTRSRIEDNCLAPQTSGCSDLYTCGQVTRYSDTSCGTSVSCDASNLGECELN